MRGNPRLSLVRAGTSRTYARVHVLCFFRLPVAKLSQLLAPVHRIRGVGSTTTCSTAEPAYLFCEPCALASRNKEHEPPEGRRGGAEEAAAAAAGERSGRERQVVAPLPPHHVFRPGTAGFRIRDNWVASIPTHVHE